MASSSSVHIDDGFFAILGYANGASNLKMLTDHKDQVGHRTVNASSFLVVEKSKTLKKMES